MNTVTYLNAKEHLSSTNRVGSAIHVENYFERAIEQANVGLPKLAVNTAREALIFAKQQNHPMLARIHRLLAFLFLDLKQPEQAKLHTWYAIRSLRSTSPDYHLDRELLELLLDRIKEESAKQGGHNLTPLAA